MCQIKDRLARAKEQFLSSGEIFARKNIPKSRINHAILDYVNTKDYFVGYKIFSVVSNVLLQYTKG